MNSNFEVKLGKAVALLTRAREALMQHEPKDKDKAVLKIHKALLAEIDQLIVDCER